jgi:hypothetical protein
MLDLLTASCGQITCQLNRTFRMLRTTKKVRLKTVLDNSAIVRYELFCNLVRQLCSARRANVCISGLHRARAAGWLAQLGASDRFLRSRCLTGPRFVQNQRRG